MSPERAVFLYLKDYFRRHTKSDWTRFDILMKLDDLEKMEEYL